MTPPIRTWVSAAAVMLTFLVSADVAEGAESGTSGAAKLRRWMTLRHDHREVPLFSLYGPFETEPDAATLRKAKAAVDVYDFDEVTLGDDEKTIGLRLRPQERRTFAQLAQKHPGKWVVAVAPAKDQIYSGKSVVAATRLTPSMANGQITFPHPQCAEIARALRWRFRLAEFRSLSW
jgi:hypothetical protein